MPELTILMIDGHGDPNTAAAYREAVEALYSVAYTAKFAVKHAPDEVDIGVMPLEGRWWTTDMSTFSTDRKSGWDWTMMITQPGQVTADVGEEARAKAARKKALEAIDRLRFDRFTEGLAGQIMHIGPYAAEGPTIARLHAIISENGYTLTGKHHEIYLSAPRRPAPEKLKTTVRQPVART